MNLLQDLKENYVKNPKRLTHIEGVVAWSVKLASHLHLDLEAMRTAAYLHDFTKPYSNKKQGAIFKTYQERIPEDFPDFAYHAVSAALVGEHVYQIKNPDILNAVRYHTTGRRAMSLFEKVLMFADKTEPSRPYKEADLLRRKALEDFDQAFILMLSLLKEYDRVEDRLINPYSDSTYQFYLSQMEAS
jgi:predicted HD superfamily hydrolase involved in NAD metabolism